MNTQIEQVDLFRELMSHLYSKTEELNKDFQTVRWLGASDFKQCLGSFEAVRFDPTLLEKALKNKELWDDRISRQRYYLVKAFIPILAGSYVNLEAEYADLLSYWDNELKDNT